MGCMRSRFLVEVAKFQHPMMIKRRLFWFRYVFILENRCYKISDGIRFAVTNLWQKIIWSRLTHKCVNRSLVRYPLYPCFEKSRSESYYLFWWILFTVSLKRNKMYEFILFIVWFVDNINQPIFKSQYYWLFYIGNRNALICDNLNDDDLASSVELMIYLDQLVSAVWQLVRMPTPIAADKSRDRCLSLIGQVHLIFGTSAKTWGESTCWCWQFSSSRLMWQMNFGNIFFGRDCKE